MAFSSYSRGLRLITIGEKVFRWRFKTRVESGVLWIYGATAQAPLRVTFLGFRYEWSMIVPNSSVSVTKMGPAFARRAIEYGLANGWKPDAKGAPFEIEWNGEEFSLVKPNAL